MGTQSVLEAALDYVRHGLSVMPLGGDKKPLLKTWEPYMKRLPSEQEVEGWWGGFFKGAGVGIITGTVSGLVVLDVDPRHHGDATLMKAVTQHHLLRWEDLDARPPIAPPQPPRQPRC